MEIFVYPEFLQNALDTRYSIGQRACRSIVVVAVVKVIWFGTTKNKVNASLYNHSECMYRLAHTTTKENKIRF